MSITGWPSCCRSSAPEQSLTRLPSERRVGTAARVRRRTYCLSTTAPARNRPCTERAVTYDLVIRDGTVVDGSGFGSYRADVGIVGDRIAFVGRIRERGARELDAEGQVVTPGFVDGHTHLDAQVFWDRVGVNSCWHGVTTVVMGNCGFTLAR